MTTNVDAAFEQVSALRQTANKLHALLSRMTDIVIQQITTALLLSMVFLQNTRVTL